MSNRRGNYDSSMVNEGPSDINTQDHNIYRFKKGDLVTPYYAPAFDFYGVVINVNQKENRVYVDFNGTIRQMDPDEIRVVLKQRMFEDAEERRGVNLTASKKNAIYHCDLGRKYKYTNEELDSGSARCPKCKSEMDKENYKRGVKLFHCRNCGFKIPTEDIIDGRQQDIVDNIMDDIEIEGNENE